MKTSSIVMIAGLGVGAYLLYRWIQQQKPLTSAPPSVLDARTQGLQAGIAAGTYNAAALRNQSFDDALMAQGGTPGIV